MIFSVNQRNAMIVALCKCLLIGIAYQVSDVIRGPLVSLLTNIAKLIWGKY